MIARTPQMTASRPQSGLPDVAPSAYLEPDAAVSEVVVEPSGVGADPSMLSARPERPTASKNRGR
eukprot:16433511-Heterocapsa_arctica.AAC.1